LNPGIIPKENVIAPIGAYGLCLFFFLSSYLITELLLREQANSGTVHVKAFYVRRILRIWPLYFAFLLFGKLLGRIFTPFHLETSRLAAFVLLAGNFYMTRFGSSNSPVEILWSISVEEQFYLIWPTLARFGGKRLLQVASVMAVLGAWLALYTSSTQQPAAMGVEFDGAIWCNSLVQFQFFAYGALCSILLRGKLVRWSLASRIGAFALGLASWFAASFLFRVSHSFELDRLPKSALIGGYTLIAAGCLLMFLSLMGISVRSIPRSLIYLGKISYGLYVFHWLMLEVVFLVPYLLSGQHNYVRSSLPVFAAKSLVAFGATIVVAALSYRFFESPFLALKKRFTFVTSRAV
jgi:peptidoglycan/LPS O-acetylase OafA/YrhL